MLIIQVRRLRKLEFQIFEEVECQFHVVYTKLNLYSSKFNYFDDEDRASKVLALDIRIKITLRKSYARRKDIYQTKSLYLQVRRFQRVYVCRPIGRQRS